MEMHVDQTADSGDLAASGDAARYGRAAAMSRRRALAAGRSALATTPPIVSTPRRMVVATDGVPPARLARAFSMQRRRQLSKGKQVLNLFSYTCSFSVAAALELAAAEPFDVVVSDGFSGNIALKAIEGSARPRAGA